MKSSTLLTGATGLLGSALAPRLALAGVDIITHGSSLPADINADLRCRETTFATLDHVMPSAIVNLVAVTNVDGCEDWPQDAYLLNVRAVENIAAWVTRHPQTRLIQISTDHLYDGPGFNREDEISLLNIYAYSKYCAEIVASSANATILRTNFFGQVGLTQKTFVDLLVAGLRGASTVRLVTDVLFSPLHVNTLCEMIRHVLERPVAGTFNLGSHGGMSKCEFGWQVARHLGLNADVIRPVEMAELGLKARRPKNMRMDVSLFETTYEVKLPELKREILLLEKDYGLQTER